VRTSARFFSELTGRERKPLQRVNEFAAVIGRRGGKSKSIATLAIYIAGLCDHGDALVPGERGILLCVGSIGRWPVRMINYDRERGRTRTPPQTLAGFRDPLHRANKGDA
jgi:hypothetical protein